MPMQTFGLIRGAMAEGIHNVKMLLRMQTGRCLRFSLISFIDWGLKTTPSLYFFNLSMLFLLVGSKVMKFLEKL